MSDILRPVGNVPLTTTTTPGILNGVKGCKFIPGMWMNTTDMYLMIMSQDEHVPYPPAGFYEVPDKGKIVYISHFKPYQRSDYRAITEEDRIALGANPEALRDLHKWRMFVFLALEGDVPRDFVPDVNFDYKRHNIHKIAANLKRMKQ